MADPDTAASTTSRDRDPGSARRGRGDVAARALAALGGGFLLYLSFPPRTLWWLALPAFALLAAALHATRIRSGACIGFLFGLAFGLPLLAWTGEYVVSLTPGAGHVT